MGHDPTEHAQEHLQHEAAHGHGPKWIMWAALTAAFLAALAAVSASLATKHLTESTLKRIAANDQWNYYQAKSIKTSIIDSRVMEYNLADSTKISPKVAKQYDDDMKKKAEYATAPEDEKDPSKPQGMKGIQVLADSLEKVSGEHLETHETFEMSATMFHIAIAIVAIAVVAKRKEFWYISMVGGVVGIFFFGSALAHAPSEHHGEHSAAGEHATSGEHAAPHVTAGEHAATEAAHEGAAATEHH
jgi:hypothetical protein